MSDTKRVLTITVEGDPELAKLVAAHVNLTLRASYGLHAKLEVVAPTTNAREIMGLGGDPYGLSKDLTAELAKDAIDSKLILK
jgi:hypothetical protein